MSVTSALTISTPETSALCACDNFVDSKVLDVALAACAGDPIFDYDGVYYCVMHYPDQNKRTAFRVEFEKKIAAKDFNFCGVYFPENLDFQIYEKENDEGFCFSTTANFDSATFSGDANFDSAIFSERVGFEWAQFGGDVIFWAATFIKRADFSSAKFSEMAGYHFAKFKGETCFESATFSKSADFWSTRFGKPANFIFATFSEKAAFDQSKFRGATNFGGAVFSGATSFRDVVFSEAAMFGATTFSGLTEFYSTQFLNEAAFSNAQFKDYLKFNHSAGGGFGEQAALTFDSLRIEKPERLSFHSAELRPHWFINTDPRKFEFIDVRWDDDFEKEREASTSARLLSIAYRQLAMNAEENNRYGEAAQFRYNSMELLRLEKWKGWNIFSLDFWYWALSGYGERVTRAAVALVMILFLSCVPYWFTGFASSKQDQAKVGAPIRVVLAQEKSPAKQWLATLAYSLDTASLQKPEPRPVTTAARFFVGLETILAPLQAALLALAIRRKYMK